MTTTFDIQVFSAETLGEMINRMLSMGPEWYSCGGVSRDGQRPDGTPLYTYVMQRASDPAPLTLKQV